MKNLCVIFGGNSSEHDISIITGMQLCKALEAKQHIEKIYLGLDNKFYLATQVHELSFFSNKHDIKLKEIILSDGSIYIKGLFFKKYCDIDCVINCCHGGVGENGDLAGFFSVNNIKYVGSNSLSSHIAMDKNLTKKLLEEEIPVVKGIKVTKQNFTEAVELIKKEFSSHLIVKPNSLGSSIGVKVCNKNNFVNQIEAVFEMFDDALVEEQVMHMKEYNQACYKTKEGLHLSAIEQPVTKSNFLTFEDKYVNKTKGGDRIIPAEIPVELEDQIIEYTSKIYSTLNLCGIVRIDYIYDTKNKKLYFNEVNTIPGSMAFYLFEPVGIDYLSLIEQLVQNCEENKKYFYFDTGVLTKKLL